MFTGLVDAKGKVLSATKKGKSLRLEIAVPAAYRKARLGASISVNGCCLTVVTKRAGKLGFDLIPETLKRTTFGSLKSGAIVNLERPLQWRGRVEGHLVQGHIDGTARVLAVDSKGSSKSLKLKTSKALGRFIVEKGSVALNGVSLTVGASAKGVFWVHLVPHTLKSTDLGGIRPGSRLNVEADLMLKSVLAGRSGRGH